MEDSKAMTTPMSMTTVNTKIWHRKEFELWAQLGEKIRPEEGRFL
jgi:hypothetical protein